MNPFCLIGLVVFGFVCFLSPSQIASAQVDNQGQWVQTYNGCAVWLHFWSSEVNRIQESPVATWSGKCLNGYADGQGRLDITTSLGSYRYEGGMLGGRMSGLGSIDFPDGRTLTGTFLFGLIGPQVTYTQPNGLVYKGGWFDGKQQGNGEASFPDGSHYHGDWSSGKESGHGRLTLSNGFSFDGNFDGGEFKGRGTLFGPDGSSITSDWSDWKASGASVAIRPNGERYEGFLQNTKREGIGVYRWPDGSVYDGSWKNNVPDGRGSLKRSDGSQFYGTWSKGCYSDGRERLALFVRPDECKQ